MAVRCRDLVFSDSVLSSKRIHAAKRTGARILAFNDCCRKGPQAWSGCERPDSHDTMCKT